MPNESEQSGVRPPSQALNARDHLANERTFLAYLRTAIALVSFGITINRFSLYLLHSELIARDRTPRWSLLGAERIGLGMVIGGLALTIWAAFHFQQVSVAIERGDYQPNRRMVWAITVAVLILGAVVVSWLYQK